MSKGPLAATDRRRLAGHKRHKAGVGADDDPGRGENGASKKLAHLITDRKKPNGTAKRVD